MLINISFRKKLFSILLIIISLQLKAQQKATYWVCFTDKTTSGYHINQPNKFLSQRAINRRLKNNIPITEKDLPVSKIYTDSLENMGVRVLYTSKWFNAATIEVSNETLIPVIQKISFVVSTEKTRDSKILKSAKLNTKNDIVYSYNSLIYNSIDYGESYTQIEQMNGQFLHNNGYRGKGILIALLDAGFKKANEYRGLKETLNEERIVGTRDFVKPGNNVYNEHNHGAAVLSTIASLYSGNLIGTAPEASFWLLRSEDAQTESPVECDNWIAAAELADSAGADIISTSLGYNEFDNPSYNYTYSNVNGQTARISIAAEIASSKGIVVLASAGNDGNQPWHYIGVPADAKNILAVGAITANEIRAEFSSFGPSFDGRVKPEIVAMGQSIVAETSPGIFSTVSGTSFSCPISAGLVACLIQAFPNVPATEIRNSIIQSASQFSKPDSILGYGIPNFEKAFELLNLKSPLNSVKNYAFPNPFMSSLVLINQIKSESSVRIECYDISGNKIFVAAKNGGITQLSAEVAHLNQGLYFFRCTGENESVTIKAIKINESK